MARALALLGDLPGNRLEGRTGLRGEVGHLQVCIAFWPSGERVGDSGGLLAAASWRGARLVGLIGRQSRAREAGELYFHNRLFRIFVFTATITAGSFSSKKSLVASERDIFNW